MIDAKELRIGNFVNSIPKQKTFPVSIKTLRNLQSRKCYIEPILITEEWLLKFGFNESETDLRKGNIIVRFRDDNSLIITIIDMVVLPKCQYIHELQNLYFALHRQELEIRNGKELKIYSDGNLIYPPTECKLDINTKFEL